MKKVLLILALAAAAYLAYKFLILKKDEETDGDSVCMTAKCKRERIESHKSTGLGPSKEITPIDNKAPGDYSGTMSLTQRIR